MKIINEGKKRTITYFNKVVRKKLFHILWVCSKI